MVFLNRTAHYIAVEEVRLATEAYEASIADMAFLERRKAKRQFREDYAKSSIAAYLAPLPSVQYARMTGIRTSLLIEPGTTTEDGLIEAGITGDVSFNFELATFSNEAAASGETTDPCAQENNAQCLRAAITTTMEFKITAGLVFGLTITIAADFEGTWLDVLGLTDFVLADSYIDLKYKVGVVIVPIPLPPITTP